MPFDNVSLLPKSKVFINYPNLFCVIVLTLDTNYTQLFHIIKYKMQLFHIYFGNGNITRFSAGQ